MIPFKIFAQDSNLKSLRALLTVATKFRFYYFENEVDSLNYHSFRLVSEEFLPLSCVEISFQFYKKCGGFRNYIYKLDYDIQVHSTIQKLGITRSLHINTSKKYLTTLVLYKNYFGYTCIYKDLFKRINSSL